MQLYSNVLLIGAIFEFNPPAITNTILHIFLSKIILFSSALLFFAKQSECSLSTFAKYIFCNEDFCDVIIIIIIILTYFTVIFFYLVITISMFRD